ncbi:MAG: peptide deformylase [Erysipelotrichaceae bacterium]|nr:peptide deformylase [Erysipelotrichaceae bacterium]MDY5251725.1 peptide deformylase [Erysipelotrichaceae bacterium]
MIINQQTIIKDTDPKIREKSLPVQLPLSKEDEALMKDLYTYVKESIDPDIAEAKDLRPAVGISAIQVGINKQMCAVVCTDIDKDGNEINYEYCLVNPKIISSSIQKAYLANGEGCLSVEDDHKGYVYRSARIKVKGFDTLTNKEITIRAQGFLAIVLQHEIDHFSGTLYYDHISKNDPFMKNDDAIEI